MFCEQTFSRQEELGPHVLSQHPTSFQGPTVLCVEAEFRIPGERARAGTGDPAVPGEDVPRCSVCGLASQDPSQLEAHLRGHKDCFTFRCSVCGRRFKEPWFLKTHMRMHAKAGSKGRAQDPEAPVTVNGVVQAPPPEPALTRYRMCLVCGFFFYDHDALAQHSRVHRREPDHGGGGGGGGGAVLTQESFLLRLGLHPHPHNQSERSSRGIPQLDPFTTYQAWQLATRGKIAMGPHPSKDSTDNEDGVSDKDESGSSVPDGDRGPKEVPAPEPPSQDGPGTRRRCLMQRVKEKERPTRCEDCRRTFRTYHQLVLHSRVHRRQKGGEDGPTSADVRLEQTEEGCEEGCEEALLENPGAGTCRPLRTSPLPGVGITTSHAISPVSQVRTPWDKPKAGPGRAATAGSRSAPATT